MTDKTKAHKYVWVEVDDWAGLFKDGRCILEGHSLAVHEVCREFGVEYTFDEDKIDAYLRLNGRFPDDINDLPGVEDGKLPK